MKFTMSIPNSRLIKSKVPKGVKMSDLLKPLWDANIEPRATNEQIKSEAWQRSKKDEL